ncbi:nicotinamidase [Tropheryma whipplei]|uniref:nicotinamidase n=2 Tax=Tropheryma whipplei TaxID=2039 RepID=UPI0004AEF95F|nr:nicotinamidase [Tropheryma whipplei]
MYHEFIMPSRHATAVNNRPTSALLVVDIQKDFCEDGALAVLGGNALAKRISCFLSERQLDYTLKIASRDWHAPNSSNNGHFSENPDFSNSWPIHCVANTPGSAYHDDLPVDLFDKHIYKGFGSAAYSAFEGFDKKGVPLEEILAGIQQIDIAGIATDYCVYKTAVDSIKNGFITRVLLDLCVEINKERSEACVLQLQDLGVHIVNSYHT